MLSDPARTGYIAVALPEEMPVTETLELGVRLEDAVDLGLDAIVVNGLYPERFSRREAEALRAAAANGLAPEARRRCAPRSASTSARGRSAPTCAGSSARRAPACTRCRSSSRRRSGWRSTDARGQAGPRPRAGQLTAATRGAAPAAHARPSSGSAGYAPRSSARPRAREVTGA